MVYNRTYYRKFSELRFTTQILWNIYGSYSVSIIVQHYLFGSVGNQMDASNFSQLLSFGTPAVLCKEE